MIFVVNCTCTSCGEPFKAVRSPTKNDKHPERHHLPKFCDGCRRKNSSWGKRKQSDVKPSGESGT